MRLKFYRPSGIIFYDCVNAVYQFIKPFFDKKKCLILRNMVPLSFPPNKSKVLIIFVIGNDVYVSFPKIQP